MLTLKSVTKTFPGSNGSPVTALNNIDLEVKSGDFITVIGTSGSGKSTLLFSLGGLMQPSSGKITFDDVDLYGITNSERAKLRQTRIGFVFQTFNLIPYLTCLENVAYPAILTGENKKDAMDNGRGILGRLGLEGRFNHRPATVSVGERQRVAIGRALINKPGVLLADEPTGNLDPDNTLQVMQIFSDINALGQTVVMVSHDHSLIKAGHRVIRLNNGNIEKEAKPQEEVHAI